MGTTSLGDSMRRGMALGMAISLHLGVLVLVSRPAAGGRSLTSIRRGHRQALQVRLLTREPQRPSALAVTVRQEVRPAGNAHPALLGHLPQPVATRHAVPIAASSPGTTPAALLAAPLSDAGRRDAVSDAGFRERLRNVQGSERVRGVPGSDTPLVAGIHLSNPDQHGIATVMRRTQRLFGISSRHCLDVEAWRQLSPRELGARHLAARDVDRIAEKYRCDFRWA